MGAQTFTIAAGDQVILSRFATAVTTQLSSAWGLEVALRRSHMDILEARSGVFPTEHTVAVMDFSTIEALALRSFGTARFRPYVGAGAGIASLDIDVADRAVRESNRLSLALTGGARFQAASWVGFRFDVRARAVYLGARCHGDEGWRDSGRWTTTGEVMFGLYASFGGRS